MVTIKVAQGIYANLILVPANLILQNVDKIVPLVQIVNSLILDSLENSCPLSLILNSSIPLTFTA